MTVAKHMYAVFMVVTLVAAYYSGTLATQDTSKITIRTPSSWYLIVRDDGSAVYGYGAGGGITVDAETFNIEDVRRRLAPSLTDENVARPCFAVWIDVGEPRPAAQYTQDSETVGSLFEDARRAANAPQFDEIWARKPPVATQPSTRPTTQQTSRPDSEISRVWVYTPSGWHLTIRPDGSATYGFGAGGGPLLAPGTFDFQKVLSSLQASLSDDGKHKTHYGVVLRHGEERTSRAKYTQDAETVGDLFDAARNATEGPIPRQDELWERKPPVPNRPMPWASTRPATKRGTTQPQEK